MLHQRQHHASRCLKYCPARPSFHGRKLCTKLHVPLGPSSLLHEKRHVLRRKARRCSSSSTSSYQIRVQPPNQDSELLLTTNGYKTETAAHSFRSYDSSSMVSSSIPVLWARAPSFLRIVGLKSNFFTAIVLHHRFTVAPKGYNCGSLGEATM